MKTIYFSRITATLALALALHACKDAATAGAGAGAGAEAGAATGSDAAAATGAETAAETAPETAPETTAEAGPETAAADSETPAETAGPDAPAAEAATSDGGPDQAIADATPAETASTDSSAAETAASLCASPCPPPTSPCQYALCEPKVGCLFAALPDQVLCDDGDPCSAGSVCAGGQCGGGKPVSCADSNPCTADSCDPKAGCVHLPLSATPCDDGDACTADTVCQAGTCGGGIGVCACLTSADCGKFEDGDLCNGTLYCETDHTCQVNPASVVVCPKAGSACQLTACDPKAGKCQTQNLPELTPCSDGKACTAGDACIGGQCQGGPNLCCQKDADCATLEDGDLCNGTLFCNKASGNCQLNPKTVVYCPTANDTACGKNACNPKTGACQFAAVAEGGACDDGNPCTDSACKSGLCTALTNTCQCQQTSDCGKYEDGNLCNGTLYCQQATKTCQVNPATVVQCSAASDSPCLTVQCQPKTGLCAPVPHNDGAACDADGNNCTSGDFCAAGTCKPGTGICACQANSDCLPFEDGNPCNGTLYCDKIANICKVNPATVVACKGGLDSACAHNVCVPETGQCALLPFNEGLPCEADGNLCTASDHCQSGLCQVSANACQCQTDGDCAAFEDGNPCNGTLFCNAKIGACAVNPKTVIACPSAGDTECLRNTCSPKTGQCAPVPVNELGQCDADGNPCTLLDRCLGGACKAGLNQCQCNLDQQCSTFDDADLCNGQLACTGLGAAAIGLCVPATNTAVQCGAGGQCTADVCQPKNGLCQTVPINDGKPCDDGIACTGGDLCAKGTCAGTQPGCDDGEPCTVDLCDLAAKKCLHAPQPCSDNDPCTTDSCVNGQGCKHVAQNNDCDDGNLCTLGDQCKGGKCVAGSQLQSCDDGAVCTLDACSPLSGCVHQAVAGPCSDGNTCTVGDQCSNGACLGASMLSCSDGNACTDDVCQAGSGCVYLPNAATCSDGNVCSQNDFCQAASCKAGKALDCNDGDGCTDDSCNNSKGCQHFFNKAPCDDGLYCTVNDACHGNGLCDGVPRDCQIVAGPCKTAQCDEKADQCTATPVADGAACDDGDPCTPADACLTGACQGGANQCLESQWNIAGAPKTAPSLVATPSGGFAVSWAGGSGDLYARQGDKRGSRLFEELRYDDQLSPTQPAPRLAVRGDGTLMALSFSGNATAPWSTGACPQKAQLGALRATFLYPIGAWEHRAAGPNPSVALGCTGQPSFSLSQVAVQALLRPDGGFAFVQEGKTGPVAATSYTGPDVPAVVTFSQTNDFQYVGQLAPTSTVWNNDGYFFTAFAGVMTAAAGGDKAWRYFLAGFAPFGSPKYGLFVSSVTPDAATGSQPQMVGAPLAVPVKPLVAAARSAGGAWVLAERADDPDEVTLATDATVVAVFQLAGRQHSVPALATAADGSLLIGWSAQNGDGSGFGVLVRRFGTDGKPLGPAWIANALTSGDQRDPALAILSDGSLAVAWHDAAGKLWLRRFDLDGKPASDNLERLANQQSAGSQSGVVAASAPGGSVALAVWQGPVDGLDGSEIRARLIGADGKPASDEFAVNATSKGEQITPAVAGTGGTFAVAWNSGGQDGDGDGVFARLLDGSGKAKTSEIAVNLTTKGGQAQPSVAMQPSGAWMVAWTNTNTDGLTSIFARGFDAGGGPVGNPVMVFYDAGGTAQRPSIAALSNGTDYLVFWEKTAPGKSWDIMGVRVNAAGVPFSGSFSTTDQFHQTAPKVAGGPNGAAVCWQDGLGVDALAICAKIDEVSLGLSGGNVLTANGNQGGQRNIALAAMPGANFKVAWTAQSLDGSGTAIGMREIAPYVATVAPRFQANRTTAGNQANPAVASVAGGSLVFWIGDNADGSGSGVVYRAIGD